MKYEKDVSYHEWDLETNLRTPCTIQVISYWKTHGKPDIR